MEGPSVRPNQPIPVDFGRPFASEALPLPRR